MGYIPIIQTVLEHIDEHISEPLTLEDLAAVAHFSTHHFCRVFERHVGYSPMSYVRLRRLAYAVSELGSNRKLIDIAMDYGFNTYSAFSKAFKRHYQEVSPAAYRLAHQTFPLPALPNLSRTTHYTGEFIMTPKFITKPSIRLAGYSIRTRNVNGENNTDIPAFWQAIMSDGRMETLHGATCFKNHAEYGLCFNHNQESDEFSYMIALELADGAEAGNGFDTYTTAPVEYAVFATSPSAHADFTANIQGVWRYIWEEWFPTSGYEYDPKGVDFEHYISEMNATEMVCEVYIPVIKKA